MWASRSIILPCLAVFLAAAAFSTPASAAQRIAMVIGNATYEHAPQLANPLNDANDIGAALDRLGFEVDVLANADYDGMRRGLRAFARAATTAEIALVFYAGHGIEVDKRNFLIPVDARLLSDREVEFETVSLDLVSRAVEGASGLGLVILDACRDNPFASAMQQSGGTRSIGRGLASVEPAGETLVAYAAKGGSVAADGIGRNSPYTTALLAHVEEPGLEIGLMFRKVRDAVLTATGRQQEPFVYGSLSSKGFYLSAAPATVTPKPGGKVEDIAKSDEQLFWESVRSSRDPADLHAYLEQFPEGTFAALARNRITRLSNPQGQAASYLEEAELALGLNRDERQRIQTALWASGFDPGDRDGLFGQTTRKAIGKWQASLRESETGYLDVDTAKTLLEVAPDLSGGVWAIATGKPCRLWNPGPQLGETVTWSGRCKDGKASGEGRAVWATARGEETYEGQYHDGRKHGRGKALWLDGRSHEGEWRHGKEHGKGAFIATDGTRYEGVWQDGRIPDKGVIVWRHDRRYEGEWQDGKPHGRGTWTSGATSERYEGDFRNGKRHGRGIYSWRNGYRYEGEFRNGRYHGQGTLELVNGDRYEGEFRDGSYHGQGIWTEADGDRYEGQFLGGLRHGRGVHTWANVGRYEGEFRRGEYYGQGIFTWSDGGRYEGEWRAGSIHGPGAYFDKSGQKVAAGTATDGCFGKRDGWWLHWGKSAKACGFE